MSRSQRALLAMLLAGGPLAGHAACTLNALGMNFGGYDVFRPEDTEMTATLEVSCDVDTHYEISLSAGLGSYTARTLTSGTDLLIYNLFVDPTRLSIWGDGSAGTGTVSGQGTSANYAVYGRIPARQNAPVGQYSDSVTVTVTF